MCSLHQQGKPEGKIGSNPVSAFKHATLHPLPCVPITTEPHYAPPWFSLQSPSCSLRTAACHVTLAPCPRTLSLGALRHTGGDPGEHWLPASWLLPPHCSSSSFFLTYALNLISPVLSSGGKWVMQSVREEDPTRTTYTLVQRQGLA